MSLELKLKYLCLRKLVLGKPILKFYIKKEHPLKLYQTIQFYLQIYPAERSETILNMKTTINCLFSLCLFVIAVKAESSK